MDPRSEKNLLSPKSGWQRANKKLQQLLKSSPFPAEGLNYRYAHNLHPAPSMTPEEVGISRALLALEDLAEYLIRIKGKKNTREAREKFCELLDQVRHSPPEFFEQKRLYRGRVQFVQHDGTPLSPFSPKDEETVWRVQRSLSIALVALWEAPPQWLARLRRCRNEKCLHPFFLDKSAGAVAKTCGSVACRKSYSRAKQSRIGVAGSLSHIADVKKFFERKNPPPTQL
jgi:hypothetical protein